MRLTLALSAALLSFTAIVSSPGTAAAVQCSDTAAGFDQWTVEFKQEAEQRGVDRRTLDRVFSKVSYSNSTIRADRGQRSFRLSFDEFMQKRGGQTIINRGKTMKKNNAALLSRLEKRYGVPPGPLIAIWGMETGFGSFLGKEHTLSSVATLAFDCRRSEFFTEQLYAALELVQRGSLDVNAKGAAHGEIGQTQFLPRNVILYGIDGDGDGKVDMVGSRADALASTANFLRGHGWQPGVGYQPEEPNFAAIKGWNAAGVYQQAIAYIAARIDEE